MSIFAGTTLKFAGVESLSFPANKVISQICDKFRSPAYDDSTIEIFDNGCVREVLQICLDLGTTLTLEFIDGRLVKFAQDGVTLKGKFAIIATNLWISRKFDWAELEADLEAIEQHIEASKFDELMEEAITLNEWYSQTNLAMPDDAIDRHFQISHLVSEL